jgi:UDP-glucose 4-epimerase
MTAYAGRPVLVLGASGFIGAWTASALCRAGAIVHAVGRDRARTTAALTRQGAQATVTVADLAGRGSIARVVDAVRPAIVFNLCGYGVDHGEVDARSMTTLNADLVAELCETLATRADHWPGLRLVHAGSALEYGTVAGVLREDSPASPTTNYGRSKLTGTGHVRRFGASAGLPSVVARLFTVYGPGEHHDRLLPALVRAATSGSRLALTGGKQGRDFTYVEDVVEGLLRLGVSEAEPGEVVNLATGTLTSVRTFAETAAAVLGIDVSKLDFGAIPVADGEMFHQEVSVSRLTELLSWTPATRIADGIRRTWEHRDVG